VAAWRGNGFARNILLSLGATLLGAGLVIPTWLGPVERAWMALAHAISKVTTPIVMGVMYLVVLTPAGVIRRMAGGNPLAHQLERDSFWKSRPDGPADPARLKRQF
jgi:hypothetical protein